MNGSEVMDFQSSIKTWAVKRIFTLDFFSLKKMTQQRPNAIGFFSDPLFIE